MEEDRQEAHEAEMVDKEDENEETNKEENTDWDCEEDCEEEKLGRASF